MWEATHSPASVRKQRSQDASLRFGIFWPYSRTPVPSAFVASQNPDVLDLDAHIALARGFEDAGLDFLLLPDGYASGSDAASEIGFQDPSTHGVLTAVPLILATKRIGVLSTMHTTFLHPVHVARFGGHLDQLSGGRWGWNIVAGNRPNEARLFGFEDLPDHDLRYDMAEENVTAVKALWTEHQGISHQGANYRIEGRMRGPRPAAQPLLVSAASSSRGRRFAVAHCDYLFASITAPSDIAEIRADIRRHAVDRPELPILLFATMLVREEAGEAERLWDRVQESLHPEAQKVWSSQLAKATHGGKLTRDYPVLLGTPAEVARQMMQLREETGIAGFVLRMPFWGREEATRTGAVLAHLQSYGAWCPPSSRQHCW